MREIVPYVGDYSKLNLRQTLMAGLVVHNVTDFFKTHFSGNLSDLMENGKSQGAILFIPGVSAQELLSDFNGAWTSNEDAWDAEGLGVKDFEPHLTAKGIKRKARR